MVSKNLIIENHTESSIIIKYEGILPDTGVN